MMRIAVAGGGGLGFLIATSLSQAENAYNVVVLSRTPRPEYAAHDIQVHPVNYYSHESLSYALQGVDLVISTISGPEQLNLILAAGEGNVRHFIPSEFEGSIRNRPAAAVAAAPDPLDRGSTQALALLQHLALRKSMRYTVFTCGILMETFLPFGLGTMGIGYGAGVATPGDYLLDINGATAEYAELDAKGHPVRVCLTSVYDLARFIVAAIDLGPANWPNEFTLRGDRMTLRDLVDTCGIVRNVAFSHQILHYPDLAVYHYHAARMGDFARAAYYQRMMATADGRYDFSEATLNDLVDASPTVDVPPLGFAQWLASVSQAPSV